MTNISRRQSVKDVMSPHIDKSSQLRSDRRRHRGSEQQRTYWRKHIAETQILW